MGREWIPKKFRFIFHRVSSFTHSVGWIDECCTTDIMSLLLQSIHFHFYLQLLLLLLLLLLFVAVNKYTVIIHVFYTLDIVCLLKCKRLPKNAKNLEIGVMASVSKPKIIIYRHLINFPWLVLSTEWKIIHPILWTKEKAPYIKPTSFTQSPFIQC